MKLTFIHRQNNALLDELAGKVSALRGVTVDIYDSARNQDMIDANVRIHTTLSFAQEDMTNIASYNRTTRSHPSPDH